MCCLCAVFGLFIIASATASYGSGTFVAVQLFAFFIGFALYIVFTVIDLDIIDETGHPSPRKCDLRAFVVTGSETKVWKSGLTRFSRQPDSFVVNSSQGGGFKDTWVMGDN